MGDLRFEKENRLLAKGASSQFLIDATDATIGYDPYNHVGLKDLPLGEIYEEFFDRVQGGTL